MICMNDFIVNNIVLIVKQDMIREALSDIVPDMVRSIVREELTSVREIELLNGPACLIGNFLGLGP